MRKLIIPLALGAIWFPAFAVSSPFAGSEAGIGKFYLYQVETGRWLQPNMSMIDNWTTHSELGGVGIDVELRKLDGFEGFQIYVDFNNNGELNGSDEDRFFFDQENRDLCDWIFVPVEVEGVSNAYKIMIKAKPDANNRSRIEKDTYIGGNENGDFGGLSDNPEYTTWQLVSREDRLKWMQRESANGPVDASWLIPWYDRGRNDHRENLWTQEWRDGEGNALDGTQGYPVQEKYNNWIGKYEIELTDLPKGYYGFAVQAFHRDGGIDDPATLERWLNGTDNLDRVKYYAGDVKANVMSIFSEPETEGRGFRGDWRDKGNEGGPNGIPNNMEAAARVMYIGHYINDYIVTQPNDEGNLVVGIEKTGAANGDWLIVKRTYLQYYGDIASSLVALVTNCDELKEEFKFFYTEPFNGLKALDDALESANAALASKDMDKITSAFNTLNSVYHQFANGEIKDAINTISEHYGFIKNEEDPEWAAQKNMPVRAQLDVESLVEKACNATTAAEFRSVAQELKVARRMRAAIHTEDLFDGWAPEEGKFFLYNMGQKLVLQNGSDWGTHAALGHVGLELKLNAIGDDTFTIQSGLDSENDYMGPTGYLDTPEQSPYIFIPVEDAPGIYNIKNRDNNCYLTWNPYGPVDAGNSSEANVSSHVDGFDPSNPNSQWKLVTYAERLALIEEASEENPVDLTFMLSRPDFNKKVRFNEYFWNDGFGVWEEDRNNHSDLAFESWNSDPGVAFSHQLEDLPEGVYKVCIQGFYRDGDHGVTEGSSNAQLFAGNGNGEYNTVKLPHITFHAGDAPGEGVATGAGNYPEYCDQACEFFRTGLYNVYVTGTVKDGYTFPIGVEKTGKDNEKDWIVVDNIRIYYYGDKTTEEVVNSLPDPNAK